MGADEKYLGHAFERSLGPKFFSISLSLCFLVAVKGADLSCDLSMMCEVSTGPKQRSQPMMD